MVKSNDEKVISKMVQNFFNQLCDEENRYVKQIHLLDFYSRLQGFEDFDDESMLSSDKESFVVKVDELMKDMNTSNDSKITL